MTKATHTNEATPAAMDNLIDRASKFDVDALEAQSPLSTRAEGMIFTCLTTPRLVF